VLETAVHDGPQQLRLEQEVLEARGVDADEAGLLGARARGAGIGAGLGLRGQLFLLVVDELLGGVGHGSAGFFGEGLVGEKKGRKEWVRACQFLSLFTRNSSARRARTWLRAA